MSNLGRYPLQLRVTTHTNGKDIPLQAWEGPEVFSSYRLPEFVGSWHVKVARLSAIRTLRLSGDNCGTRFR